jgi:hypothetical protein
MQYGQEGQLANTTELPGALSAKTSPRWRNNDGIFLAYVFVYFNYQSLIRLRASKSILAVFFPFCFLFLVFPFDGVSLLIEQLPGFITSSGFKFVTLECLFIVGYTTTAYQIHDGSLISSPPQSPTSLYPGSFQGMLLHVKIHVDGVDTIII